MKKIIGVLAVALLSATVSCNVKNDQEHEHNNMHENGMHDDDMHSDSHDGHEHSNMEESARVITQNSTKNSATSGIIDAYFEIKNGLVADSKEKTADGGKSLLTAISKFDMSTLSEDVHKEYMEIQESAKEHAEHIIKSPIDHQREHFEDLSKDITDLITLLGTDKVVYQDFCPMVNKNKGAYWLSETKEITNPYFGSKMMKCGSVEKQFN